jgi:hypothetical protein
MEDGQKRSTSDFWKPSNCSERNGEEFNNTWELEQAPKLALMPRNFSSKSRRRPSTLRIS